MIIWISSYPKSGNTWVRSLISSYYFSDDGKFDFNLLNNIDQYPQQKFFNQKINKPGEISNFWESSQREIIRKKKIIFFKTHNALASLNGKNFTSQNFTLGAIYLVRDPRNLITSLKNHYNLNYQEALDFMINDKKYIYDNRFKENYSTFHFLSSWSNHYKSWILNKMFKILIIKYEDLEYKTYETTKNIILFINNLIGEKNNLNKNKIVNCIKTTNFQVLQKKEEQTGFMENVSLNHNKKINFFYLGNKNKWQNILSSEIKIKTNNLFKNDLKYFNYEE
tara:strand:- start:2095 stop:2934 length:840 start_codon:yes stop_codon:yes gene_type:complete